MDSFDYDTCALLEKLGYPQGGEHWLPEIPHSIDVKSVVQPEPMEVLMWLAIHYQGYLHLTIDSYHTPSLYSIIFRESRWGQMDGEGETLWDSIVTLLQSIATHAGSE